MRQADANPDSSATRGQMIHMLNADLASGYKGIVAYVVYSQIMRRRGYADVARELELHAAEDLQHAKVIVDRIESLGGTSCVRLRSASPPNEQIAMPPSSCIRNHEPDVDLAALLGIDVSPSARLGPRMSQPPQTPEGNPEGMASGWSNQRHAIRNGAKPAARKSRNCKIQILP